MKYALLGIALAAIIFWGSGRHHPAAPLGQSCAEYLAASPKQLHGLMEHAKGYVTAMNLTSRGHGTMPGKQIPLDEAAIHAETRRHCDQNRNDHYLRGVDIYVKNAR